MDGEVTIALAGDVMTGRGIDQILQRPSAPQLFESYVRDARDYVRLAERVNGPVPRGVDAGYVWGDALAELRRAAPQLRLVNLETAVTTSDDAWPGKGIHYRMHPANVACLNAAAIDCCNLANNHVLDWGRAGLDETLRTLHAAGVRTTGAGRNADSAWAPAALPLAGERRVLVWGCATETSGVPADWAAGPERSGVALLPDLSDATARRLADQVKRLRRGDEHVIVSIHWGDNWVTDIPAEHRAFAHRLIELGAADIVHGHSSHHPLPVEVYRERLVLYGCGDLVNDYEGIGPHGNLRSDVGCLYLATLGVPDGALRRLEIVPMQLRRFRLERADAAARRSLLRLFGDGAAGSRLAPAAGGNWSLQWQR
jgi:poly-gamma-glutamate synthesis protein (capsule biosynthesis protein)